MEYDVNEGKYEGMRMEGKGIYRYRNNTSD